MRRLHLLLAVLLMAAAVPSISEARTAHPRRHHRGPVTTHRAVRRGHGNHRADTTRRAVIADASGSDSASGTTYYVSPDGSDANRGTSAAEAWQTIARVNDTTLHPGDRVLFEGGQRFGADQLMPDGSGTARAPITFGSYGTGQATIAEGVWFISDDYLTFENLRMGPASGLQGGNESHQVDHITVQRCTFDESGNTAQPNVAINSYGSDWTITGNTVQNIGGSGMYVNGDRYTISGNTIANTGLAANVPYAMHGIYLKVSNATVTHNTITNSSDAGISVRYRSSIIADNVITGGDFGISWFQYDGTAGTSHWTHNTIRRARVDGIYVSASDQGGSTRESFVITGNTIQSQSQPLLLKPTTGAYSVSGNA